MIAALGRRPCAIKGLSDGDDVVRTRLAVEALGARVEVAESGEVTVTGGMSGARNPIDLGNSGTGIRLMAGLVAGLRLHHHLGWRRIHPPTAYGPKSSPR